MVFNIRTLVYSIVVSALIVTASPVGEGVSLSEGPSSEPSERLPALTAAQVASFKPYTYYAAAAYCAPAKTLAWNCGSNCDANRVSFTPIASGGNGAATQYWYVGYDTSLKTIIVGYQGTDSDKIVPLLTNADFFQDDLDSSLFPGVPSNVKTHNGFGEAQARSAKDVLAAVKSGLSAFNADKVTLVGHSLGGAIATISAIYLSLNLPPGTQIRTVAYGLPRVGNQEFANYFDARVSGTRINNKKDLVPIIPGRGLGYRHTSGEVHIDSSNQWISCPGQDSTDGQCTIGAVPNILVGNVGDHSGPYDGVATRC